MAGLINKMLDAMKLTYDDEYDEEYDEYDDVDEIEADIKRQEKFDKKKRKADKKIVPEDDMLGVEKPSGFRPGKSSNVVPVKGGMNLKNMEVCMICPKSDDDKREIADTLLSGKSIVINMEGLDMDLAQSIMDFTSGACYAIDGNMNGISKYILIATPHSVDLSGDFTDVQQNAEKKIDFSQLTSMRNL